MKRYVKGIGFGLLIAAVLLAVYELAGGDATVIVLLVLIAAHVKVRLDELEDTLTAMREAEPAELCGSVTQDPLSGAKLICTAARDHRSQWHEDDTPTRWRGRP